MLDECCALQEKKKQKDDSKIKDTQIEIEKESLSPLKLLMWHSSIILMELCHIYFITPIFKIVAAVE